MELNDIITSEMFIIINAKESLLIATTRPVVYVQSLELKWDQAFFIAFNQEHSE